MEAHLYANEVFPECLANFLPLILQVAGEQGLEALGVPTAEVGDIKKVSLTDLSLDFLH